MDKNLIFGVLELVVIFLTFLIIFTGTQNTVDQMQKFGLDTILNTFKPGNPSDAAMAIIKGGATRTREVFFPYLEAKLLTLVRDWFPESLAAFNRYMYTRS